jgi:2-keto-4-pentenoate hydratase/2-oxohepta-3-ene-1,7-dioic acid hydratase in catechol pathway
MKLVTFSRNGSTHIGALVTQDGQERVVDLNAAQPSLPTDMVAFLAAGDAARAHAEAAIASGPSYPLADVKLLAPVRPGKFICIGLNYRDHAIETNSPLPDFPIVFAKYSNAIAGPGDTIILPKVTEQVDYEAELGFVIGKTARHVSEADALDYVAGYLPVNDVSARDYQTRTSQWSMGKTFDTFGPLGPALVTADEVPDPHNLRISLDIDGEVLQDSNTRELIFNVPQLVASLSEVMTLEPGDVVSTGTPPGVGAARTPKRWIRDGETVSVTIEGLGTLSNPAKLEQ